MQFKPAGRLRVIRRMEGLGKEVRMKGWVGGGVVKFGADIADDLEVRDRVWKTRTGQAVRERL